MGMSDPTCFATTARVHVLSVLPQRRAGLMPCWGGCCHPFAQATDQVTWAVLSAEGCPEGRTRSTRTSAAEPGESSRHHPRSHHPRSTLCPRHWLQPGRLVSPMGTHGGRGPASGPRTRSLDTHTGQHAAWRHVTGGGGSGSSWCAPEGRLVAQGGLTRCCRRPAGLASLRQGRASGPCWSSGWWRPRPGPDRLGCRRRCRVSRQVAGGEEGPQAAGE